MAVLIVGELVFCINIVMGFFCARKDDQGEYIREVNKLANLYYSNGFKFDLLKTLPLGIVGNWYPYDERSIFKLLWLIKVFKIQTIFRALDQNFINPIIRRHHYSQVIKKE